MSYSSTIIPRDRHVPWHGARRPHEGGDAELWVRGHARVSGRECEGQALADALVAAASPPGGRLDARALERLVPALDGQWALMARWPDGSVLGATDRMRSIPLFWALAGERFALASEAQDLCAALGLHGLHAPAALEFFLAGYVADDETLYRDVRQLRPGETLGFNPQAQGQPVSRRRYYRFLLPQAPSAATGEQLQEELAAIFDLVFRRFCGAADGRRVLVPLSGGVDSRAVAAMLRRSGYENVLCFTYGRAGDPEVATSRAVAEALEYPWRHVEYDWEAWHRCMAGAEAADYWTYAAKGVSLPHLQDMPALLALREEENLAEAIVFVGHSPFSGCRGVRPSMYEAVLSAQQGAPAPDLGQIELVDEIIHHYYQVCWPTARVPPNALAALREKILRIVTVPAELRPEHEAALLELWEGESRQALFILNSIRAYELFGSRWWTLYNHALMDFLCRVPLAMRIGRRLLIETSQRHLYTGPAARLADIPLAASIPQAAGRSRPGRQHDSHVTWKTSVRRALEFVGLLEVVREVLGHQTDTPLVLEACFSQGRDPHALTLRRVLEQGGALKALPPEFLHVIRPALKRRLDLVLPLGVLTAMFLGKLYAEEGS